ncbi:hypothetical protein CWO90_32585 [Bradyrhizobium sp. Leo121]|nr:hypothetical protein CWO90_32585 [Bradyrhizobium sp. Leo121]
MTASAHAEARFKSVVLVEARERVREMAVSRKRKPKVPEPTYEQDLAYHICRAVYGAGGCTCSKSSTGAVCDTMKFAAFNADLIAKQRYAQS